MSEPTQKPVPSPQSTFATFIELLQPHMNSALVTPEAQQKLLGIAAELPPIATGGFECRLGPDQTQVDLLQFLSLENDGPELMRMFISQSGRADIPLWQRLAQLCHDWRKAAFEWHSVLSGLWLEIDADTFDPNDWTPSIFFEFNRDISPPIVHITALIQAITGAELSIPLTEQLKTLDHFLPPHTVISHIGLMLSRRVNAMRVNIQRLRPDDVLIYLSDIGWNGDTRVKDFPALFDLSDKATLCLDVGDQFLPQIAVECDYFEPPEREPRWHRLLETYSSWCDSRKVEALKAWTGESGPAEVSGTWPAHLLIDALTRPANTFGHLGRRVSHVKLTFAPAKPVQAKAYIGFGHVWREANAPGMKHPNFVSDGPTLNRCREMTADGLKFLFKSRAQPGWWRDFSVDSGLSDEWVTAYVGSVLGALPDKAAKRTAQRAWTLVSARRTSSEGWGYADATPADAESTLWGLRLAHVTGYEDTDVYRWKLRFLLQHIGGSGAARKYLSDEHEPQLCVTAAIAAAFGFPTTLQVLRESQREDGSWQGYWWYESAYTTALAVEAFALHGDAEGGDRPYIDLAGRWAVGHMRKVLDATASVPTFTLACCIRILAYQQEPSAYRELVGEAVDYLYTHQLKDGSWESSARVRVPKFVEADLSNCAETIDQRRLITTATVIGALNLVVERQILAQDGGDER